MNQEEINAKARELVEKYLPLTRVWQDEGGWVDDFKAAKRCALIDIQNTIDMLNNVLYYDNEVSDLTNYIVTKLHQQREIKQAIENL